MRQIRWLRSVSWSPLRRPRASLEPNRLPRRRGPITVQMGSPISGEVALGLLSDLYATPTQPPRHRRPADSLGSRQARPTRVGAVFEELPPPPHLVGALSSYLLHSTLRPPSPAPFGSHRAGRHPGSVYGQEWGAI